MTLVLSWLLLTAPALGDTIALRASVRLAPDAEHVRLADIADMTGDAVETLGSLVIAPVPSGGDVLEVPVSRVRALLDEAGVHWGKTNLSGRKVVVRSGRQRGISPPRAMTPVAIEAAAENDRRARRQPREHLASELTNGHDLRAAVAEFMARALSAQPNRLRLTFDERDDPFLNTPLNKHRFEIDPVSNPRSSRVDLAIRVWDGDRILERCTLSVAPAVLMPVAVITRNIDRGAVLGADDVELIEQWHAPPGAGSAGLIYDPAEAIGRAVTTRLREGDVLRPAHLQRETIVRRGEIITVRCIVGGAVISLQAEARANATEGETIEFRKPGERDTFLATVTGRGTAVLDLANRTQ